MKIELPYHLNNLGISNVWVTNGVNHYDCPYGEGVEYPNFSGLIDCAIHTVCLYDTTFDSATIKSLRDYLMISSKEMANLLEMKHSDFKAISVFNPLTKYQSRILKALVIAKMDPGMDILEFDKKVFRRPPEKFYLTYNEESGTWFHNEVFERILDVS